MDPSYLKNLLYTGREVEFEYGSNRYTVKMVDFRSTTEYSFGRKWGYKTISSCFDGILYSYVDGVSLSEMLKKIDSGSVYCY